MYCYDYDCSAPGKINLSLVIFITVHYFSNIATEDILYTKWDLEKSMDNWPWYPDNSPPGQLAPDD